MPSSSESRSIFSYYVSNLTSLSFYEQPCIIIRLRALSESESPSTYTVLLADISRNSLLGVRYVSTGNLLSRASRSHHDRRERAQQQRNFKHASTVWPVVSTVLVKWSLTDVKFIVRPPRERLALQNPSPSIQYTYRGSLPRARCRHVAFPGVLWAIVVVGTW